MEKMLSALAGACFTAAITIDARWSLAVVAATVAATIVDGVKK